MVGTCGAFFILTCKCASRQSLVPFFRHRNFKKWSEHAVFCTFWLDSVLRATAACSFPHRNLKNWSAHVVFCAFWLDFVLPATAAHSFSTSELEKWVRKCGVLRILTWKCASRHSGAPFLISLLNSYLRTRRFSERTFRTSGSRNHSKNAAVCNFPNICRMCIFFLPT